MTATSARLNIPLYPEFAQEQTNEVVSQGKNSFKINTKTIWPLHHL